MTVGTSPWPRIVALLLVVLAGLGIEKARADALDTALEAGTRDYIASYPPGMAEGWVDTMIELLPEDGRRLSSHDIKTHVQQIAHIHANPVLPERATTWAASLHYYVVRQSPVDITSTDLVDRLRAIYLRMYPAPAPYEPVIVPMSEEKIRISEELDRAAGITE